MGQGLEQNKASAIMQCILLISKLKEKDESIVFSVRRLKEIAGISAAPGVMWVLKTLVGLGLAKERIIKTPSGERWSGIYVMNTKDLGRLKRMLKQV